MADEFPRRHRAQDVRGGEIVLKRRWQRVVFLGALGAGTVLATVLAIA